MTTNRIDRLGCTLAIFQKLDAKEAALLSSLTHELKHNKDKYLSRKSLQLSEDLHLPVPLEDFEKFIFIFKKNNSTVPAINQAEFKPYSGKKINTLTNEELIKLFNANHLNSAFYESSRTNRWMAKLAVDNPELKAKLPQHEFLLTRSQRIFSYAIHEVSRPLTINYSLGKLSESAFNYMNNAFLNRHIKFPITIACHGIDQFLINPFKRVFITITRFIIGAYHGLTIPSIPELAATVPEKRPKKVEVIKDNKLYVPLPSSPSKAQVFNDTKIELAIPLENRPPPIAAPILSNRR